MSYFLKFLAWITPNDPYPYTRDPPEEKFSAWEAGGGQLFLCLWTTRTGT